MENDARMLTVHTARNQFWFPSFVLSSYKSEMISVLIIASLIHASFSSIFNTLDIGSLLQ